MLRNPLALKPGCALKVADQETGFFQCLAMTQPLRVFNALYDNLRTETQFHRQNLGQGMHVLDTRVRMFAVQNASNGGDGKARSAGQNANRDANFAATEP